MIIFFLRRENSLVCNNKPVIQLLQSIVGFENKNQTPPKPRNFESKEKLSELIDDIFISFWKW